MIDPAGDGDDIVQFSTSHPKATMWSGDSSQGGSMPPAEDETSRLALSAWAAYSGAAAPFGATPSPVQAPVPVQASMLLQQGQQQADEPVVSDVMMQQQEERTPDVMQSIVQEAAVASAPMEPPKPRGKPEAMAKALSEARLKREEEEKKRLAAKKKKRKKPSPHKSSTPRAKKGNHPSMQDPVEPITDKEYESLDKMMEQFCKVPLLAEFSRPVALLHPELIPVYSKIVTRPIDMGKVCRMIRKRLYQNTREVRLDMWRILSNCIKYHTHPSNKERSVPSFVSISLHLREYFNALWQEYMLPSDVPPKASRFLRLQMDKRQEDRMKRIKATSATYLSGKALEKTAAAIRNFIQMGGRADALDTVGVLETEELQEEDEEDLQAVVDNLQEFQKKVLEIATTQDAQQQEDYTVLEFVRDYQKCYSGVDLFENRQSLRLKVKNRLDRILGKIICPIYEANGRGVNQSSIWGCMAAAIWARESSKKPYWPALVLGILAPDDQQEDWHAALTIRNEERLPEKLREALYTGRKKAEHALKKQNQGHGEQQSFFLVEFMGTHEFIWVKESDIIESFDIDEDPNANIAAGNVTKKKRSSRAASHDATKSKTYATAIDEARWALEEFELQLNDTCGDLEEAEEDEDGEEQGYSFTVLCQSDEEAEEAFADIKGSSASDLDEANELLATDGLLDFSAAGRKEARKRAAARKKERAESAKAALKKERAESKKLAAKRSKAAKKKKSATPEAKKASREERRVEKELERKRRKRARERERVQKEELRKKKRRRIDTSEKGIPDKRARANAIVKGYLRRLVRNQEFSFTPVLQIPSSAADSSGLLGMALAFRAAAGVITMPDQDSSFLNKKPYEEIDTTSPKTSSKRVERLEEQLKLLEKEIARVKERITTRNQLTEEALQKEEEEYQEIQRRAVDAKKSDVKKRKKYGKKPATKKKQEKGTAAKDDEDGKDEVMSAGQPAEDVSHAHEDEEKTGLHAGQEMDTHSHVDAEDQTHGEGDISSHDELSHVEADDLSHGDADDQSHQEVDTHADSAAHESPDGFYSADEMEEEERLSPPAVAVVTQFDDAEEGT